MNEYIIERIVERAIDKLDARFMADGSTMTQAEYDVAVSIIDKWASQQIESLNSASI